jgi:Trk K+ transport system NAD-binding subunit
MRLYDDTLAEKVGGAFDMPALSTAQVAASAFIAAATNRRVYQQFELDGQQLHLIDLTVRAGTALVNRTVGEIQAERQVNIVMHRGADGVNVNPGHDVRLAPNDRVLVIAPIAHLRELEARNQPT